MIFHPTNSSNIFHLAPIPVYKKVYKKDIITNRVYDFGLRVLSKEQKRMGQELIDRYDEERYSTYEVNYNKN